MDRCYVKNGYERNAKKQLMLLAPDVIIAMDRPSQDIAQLHRTEHSPEITVCYWTRQRNVSDADKLDSLRRCLTVRQGM